LKNEDDRTDGSGFRAIRNLAIFVLSPQCIFRPHVVQFLAQFRSVISPYLSRGLWSAYVFERCCKLERIKHLIIIITFDFPNLLYEHGYGKK